MKRKLMASAFALSAAAVFGVPAVQAQFTCYDSYVTLSGTCPDSCGRGADCPCYTCTRDVKTPT